MSLPPESSSSILGSGSLGSESPPQEILRTSSIVSFTETPSMTSLPSRQNAGDDAAAISNAANYNENNGSGSYKSQGQSSSKNKNDRNPTLCLIFSTLIQAVLLFVILTFVFYEWIYFEETLKYGYGISAFLQFELLFVFLLAGSSCTGDGGASFFACFNVAVLAIIENVTVLYVFTTDWNGENCYLDGCTFLHGPYKRRIEFVEVHATFGLIHLIMTFVMCCIGCYSSSRRNVTSSNMVSPALPSKNHNTSQASQKPAAHRPPRSLPSSIKSSRASNSQSSRASSYRSATIKYNIRLKPSTKSKQQRNETTLNIPQKHGYPLSSYPQGQHSSTVCHPSLPPPVPRGYHHSFVQSQHFPLQNMTNNYFDGGRTMIIDVPETEQPYGFIDIQRVVIKLPPLQASESVSVPPEYRDSLKQGNEPHKRVFCTRVTEFK